MKGYEAIYRIALLIMEDIPLEEKLQAIAEILADTLNIERCVIAEIHNDDEEYKYIFRTGIVKNGGPPHELGRMRPITDCPPITEVIKSGEMYLIEDAQNNQKADYMRSLVQRADIKSVLFVPVLLRGEVGIIIILDAVCEKKNFSKEKDIDLVCRVAEIIAQIMDHERLAKHKARLEVVNFVNRVFQHELRNPMTMSFGFLRRVYEHASKQQERGELNDQKLVKWLEISLEEAQKVETTANNIFYFLINNTTLEKEDTDICEYIRHILETPVIISQNDIIKITLKCEKNMPSVNIDPGQIKNAIVNLIQNAMEYLKRHGNIPAAEKIIRLEAKKLKKSVRLTISNPGHIDNPDNIFEPFYSTSPDKLGLGLTVAKDIIEIHNATIKARQHGERVEFSIYFPLS